MIIEALIVNLNAENSLFSDSFTNFTNNVFDDLEAIKQSGRRAAFKAFSPLNIIKSSYRVIIRSSG